MRSELVLDLTAHEKTLFSGKTNGFNYCDVSRSYDRVRIELRDDQLVTGSFLYGMLLDMHVINADIEVVIVGGAKSVGLELHRSKVRILDTILRTKNLSDLLIERRKLRTALAAVNKRIESRIDDIPIVGALLRLVRRNG